MKPVNVIWFKAGHRDYLSILGPFDSYDKLANYLEITEHCITRGGWEWRLEVVE